MSRIGQAFLQLLSPKDVLIKRHDRAYSENGFGVNMLMSPENS